MEQLPEYFRPIVEFQQIMAVHGSAINDLEKNVTQLWENLFIQTCDEATLKLYEKRLDITASPSETLEYRRQRILQKYNTIVPFSEPFLRIRLTELFGDDYSMSVDPAASKITISVTSARYGAVDLLYDLLWDIIPAHLQVISNQQVTNYISGNIYADEVMARTFVQSI